MSPTTIIGNVTIDPAITKAAEHSKLAFPVAVEHRYQDRKSGEWVSKPSFIQVVAWRTLAEDAARVLEKGVRVMVTGRLDQREYEDKEGNKRQVVEIVADEIAICARSIESFQRKRYGQAVGATVAGGGTTEEAW